MSKYRPILGMVGAAAAAKLSGSNPFPSVHADNTERREYRNKALTHSTLIKTLQAGKGLSSELETTKFLEEIAKEEGIICLTNPETMEGYEIPYNELAREFPQKSGSALAVARASTAEQVSRIVALCNKHNISIVPQSGGTGLTYASTPCGDQTEIVLLYDGSDITVEGDKVIVEAGATVEEVHEAAAEHDKRFTVYFGAQGTARVGATTNPGGITFFAFGGMKQNLEAIEYVDPLGNIQIEFPEKETETYPRVAKDNCVPSGGTGIASSQGLLGYVVKAVGKLRPQPQQELVCVAGLSNDQLRKLHLIIDNLREIQEASHKEGPAHSVNFEMLEVISRGSIEAVIAAHPSSEGASGLPKSNNYLLIKATTNSPTEELDFTEHLMNLLYARFSRGDLLPLDKIILAQTESQKHALLQIREQCSDAARQYAKQNYRAIIANDPCLPVDDGTAYKHYLLCKEIAEEIYHAQNLSFGHAGDGNFHLNCAMDRENIEPLIREGDIAKLSPKALELLKSFLSKHPINAEGRMASFDKFVDFSAYHLGGVHSAEHGGLGNKTMSSTMEYYDFNTLTTFISNKIKCDPNMTFRKEASGRIFDLFVQRSTTELSGENKEAAILAMDKVINFLVFQDGLSRFTNPETQTKLQSSLLEYQAQLDVTKETAKAR